MKTRIALHLAVITAFVFTPAAARADVAFGQALTSGNLTVMVTAVRWSAIAARGIPVVPGQPDVVQVNILSASQGATSFTVTISYIVDGADSATVTTCARRRNGGDPTLIQLPVGAIKASITVQSVKVIEQIDGAEADF
jgi:hypothetical protein